MFDAWILPNRVVDPSKKAPDLNCEAHDPLLEAVDLEQKVPDLRSGGIAHSLTTCDAYTSQPPRLRSSCVKLMHAVIPFPHCPSGNEALKMLKQSGAVHILYNAKIVFLPHPSTLSGGSVA